jgi:hypothetical protein
MTKVIIYNHDIGNPTVLVPAPECLETHTIEEIAVKDVQAGKPFKIIDISELPEFPIETWAVDDADLTDGVGGLSYEFGG